ncbi:MAG: hypothetical protein IKM36_06680 [Oscillospiraceae bacterium]|nr:hypothetical protein [Oscillospiraceae bacterium]MBR3850155.1 hypothetical protein [Oscillospiraceae bacterium]
MIEPKKLAKAMKTAAKGGGYKLYAPADGRNLYLWNDLWCVVLDAERIPRLVLATIVEQTGELPRPGACGIMTTDGVQTLLQDAAEKECRFRTAAYGKVETLVKLAPIRYHGLLIYQSPKLEVFATNGAGISIAASSAVRSAHISDGCRLIFAADGECLILHCDRPSQNSDIPPQEMPVWAALESCDLGTVE